MYELINSFADNVIRATDSDLSGTTIASVVITGIVVVFIGLVLLVAFVSLYGKIFSSINNKKAEKLKAAEIALQKENEVVKDTSVTIVPEIEDGIDEEVVAVIMAAISAMSSETGKKVALKSIKTAKPQRTAWAAAGLNDYTRSF